MVKKREIKENRTKTIKVSAVVKPKELSLEDWQILIRKQTATDEKYRIKNIGNHSVFSTYQVHNIKTENKYRVEIRGETPGINYCSCPDFSINTLGICKHIEYILDKLRKKKTVKKTLEEGYVPNHSSVTLKYGIERKIAFTFGINASNSLKELVFKYFDKELFLTEWGGEHFDEFVNLAEKLKEEVHYHSDAVVYIANIRDIGVRKQCVKRTLPLGTKDKILDDLLKTDLYSYQKEGVFFAVNAGRCLIADEMGLGKTVQAIASSELMVKCFGIEKVLIICPTSLKHQWKNEIDKFSRRTSQVIQGFYDKRQELYKQDAFYNITNYNVIHRDFRSIEEWSPDLIILDEAQRIKNWKTRLAKTIKKLNSAYAIILTGTPLENRLEELHSIVEFIDRYHLGPLFRFLDTHQVTDDCGKVIGYRNLNDLGKSLSSILIRRKRQDVLSQLPGRVEKNYFVQMTPDQNEIHEENRTIVARIVNKWRKYKFLSEIDKQRLMVALQYMRMVSDDTYLINQNKKCGNKISELEIQLEELFEYKDTKVVVFSQWIKMIELITKMLERRGWKYVWLHGGVPGDKRGNLIKIFNDDHNCRVFLSTEVGGVGLNLQSASAVINVDLPWNPAILEQRISRVHRFGQKKTVRVINFITENSIEYGILSLLKFKESMFSGVLDGGEDKVFMGSNRFNKFMQTVETVSESIPDSKVTREELEEAIEDTRTSSEDEGDGKEIPQQEFVFNSKSIGELFRIGAAFFEKMSAELSNGNTESQNNSVIRVSKDEKTGRKILQIPLSDDDKMEKLLQAGKLILDLFKK